MPRPRTPIAIAKASGRLTANPKRYAGRTEPQGDGLGKPSAWMVDAYQLAAWAGFVRELPWLQESDRALTEIAATIRGRMLAGEEMPLAALTVLRQCLSAMGGTPADRSKVPPVEAEKPFDPTSIYLS